MKNIFLLILSFISLNLFAGEPVDKQIVYLSGTDNEHTVKWDFYCTGGRQSGFWTSIDVPSCWEQQGFGTYDYGRASFDNGPKYKFADESGIYKYRFAVPSDWKQKDISLVFEGSMTDTKVKINGFQVGPVHQGSFYLFKFNVTDKLQYGNDNTLEVTVNKWSADSSVNEAERTADYWIFGGIFRPVYLEITPREHISRVAVNAKASGQFTMDVFPVNLKDKAEVYSEILDGKGTVVASGSVPLEAGDSLKRLSLSVNNPLKWTSETPNLYYARYFLKRKGKVIYQDKIRFGFRTIEVRHGDGIYINGTKVKMKGINRHVWWPETGRTVNPKIDLMDIQLIKGMNMNAVRCSHYPPDQSFLDLCDSLGLYVLDELAGWQDAYSTKAGAPLVKEMVIRDVNHPSIIIWSNGNEGGHNLELDSHYAFYDPSNRPVIHAHHKPGHSINGIDCNHYENYASMQKILSDSLIYMPTEFLHCQDDGGGGAGLEDMWGLLWNAPRSGGGFLWAFLDEGVVRTDLNNAIDVDGVGAEDGVVGPHREKEGSYYAIREIYSPVKVRLKSMDDNSSSFSFENRYHFTNLNQCKFTWTLVNFRSVTDSQYGYNVVKQGDFTVSLKPCDSTEISVTMPSGYRDNDALFITAVDPFGKEIYKWSFKLRNNEQIVIGFINKPASERVKFSETDTSLVLAANGAEVSFRKLNGQICNIKTEGPYTLSLGNGPVMVNGVVSKSSYSVEKDSDGIMLDFRFTGDLGYIRWKMNNNGWLSLEYAYSLHGKYPYAGISFDFPESNIIGVKWLGKGPYRVWKNRPQGVTYNVWEKLYNNTQTGYSPWIYPEFKGYYQDVSWMEFNTIEGKFYMASKDDNLFVRLFDFSAMRNTKPYPALPSGDISFLDCIPAIGTKMATRTTGNAAVYGPMGETSELNGIFKHTLYFYFGCLK
jgi:hypothetical protein